MANDLQFGGENINRCVKRTVEIDLPPLYTHTHISMPLYVINGKKKGPSIFICAALHGDEINGMEIIRRVVSEVDEKKLTGSILAVPVVNVFGFITQSRYLPDRRDLNRSFPGSLKGSLSSRIAQIFMKEIVSKCNYGIDLHTATFNRVNLPQVRADLKDEETRKCAIAFGAPAMIQSDTRRGSLRQAAVRKGLKMLVFEGGEALRFNNEAIEIGVRGIMSVLKELNMLGWKKKAKHSRTSVEITKTVWIRAKNSGILRLSADLGDWVEKKQNLGVISDPFNEHQSVFRSPSKGIVIGATVNPLVHRGDAVINLGIPVIESNV